MKEGISRAMLSLGMPNTRAHNVWILIRHSLAAKIGLSLYAEKYQVCLLENKEGCFITTDQPVINIHANYTNGIPDMFELYYPVNPQLALVISKNTDIRTERLYV